MCLKVPWTKFHCPERMQRHQDKSVRLWNPHGGKHIKKFAGCHNQEVNDVLIAADNSKFVSCGSDKLIFQWDVTSGQVRPACRRHCGCVQDMLKS